MTTPAADALFVELLATVVAAVDMRACQATYFKTRSSEALIASKNAEKAFDLKAARVIPAATRFADFTIHRRTPDT